ncbi:MAG: glycosyltransferase family 2 protein [Actinobacteria bacterium]|nr:glycosyltransferase family 2 protein [Actinomycetota bacterium]
MVGCVIVNYRSPWEMLERCLRSVLSQADSGVTCSVTLVDNASGDGVVGQVREEFPEVRIIEMPGNPGFAAAVNRGLDEVDEPLVLMLNTDAVLMEGSLARMVAALESAGKDVAGIAPKMMSSSHEGIIDAIGIVLPPTGAAFNRGIGQCDLGQYDEEEEVAGVCFGAGLLRRELFDSDRVGPLHEGYFLYFEDSDWCMRAVSQGYRFLTAPDSIVLHMHSGVTRNESLNLKYGLIELNTLKMVTRNFESRLRVAHIVSSRCLRLLARTFIRRKFIGPNLKTISAYLGGLRGLLEERRELRSKRVVSDAKIFSMAEGEDAYFDTVAYEPDRCIDSLIGTYLRLLKKGQDPELGKLLAALYQLSRENADGQAPQVDEKTRELFAGQPPCVQDLLG